MCDLNSLLFSVSLSDFCPICKLDFDVNRSYCYCQSCSRNVCSNCSVDRPYLPALGWKGSNGERVCSDCNPAIMSELDRVARTANLDAGPTPSTEEFFTQKESLAISLGDLKCTVCKFPFSALKGACRCATCKNAVCSSCSRGNRVSASWLRTNADMVTCSSCYPQVRSQLVSFGSRHL